MDKRETNRIETSTLVTILQDGLADQAIQVLGVIILVYLTPADAAEAFEAFSNNIPYGTFLRTNGCIIQLANSATAIDNWDAERKAYKTVKGPHHG